MVGEPGIPRWTLIGRSSLTIASHGSPIGPRNGVGTMDEHGTGTVQRRRLGWLVLAILTMAGGLTWAPVAVSAAPARPAHTAPKGDKVLPLKPAVVLDTKKGVGVQGPIGPNRTVAFRVLGVGGVPATGVKSVQLNVQLTSLSAPTFVTLWASGGSASPLQLLKTTVGVPARKTGSKVMVVPVGADGRISMYHALGTSQVVATVKGYVAGTVTPPPPTTTTTTSTTTRRPRRRCPHRRRPRPPPTTTTEPPTTTTTEPPTTTTTEPPTTTTTEPPTTTTTEPPIDPDPAPAGSTWRFETESVTFTEPGQSRIVQLGNVDTQGDPTGAGVPRGVELEVVGDRNAVLVDDLGNGRIRVTSTDTVGSVVVGLRIPGVALTVPLTVMNVELGFGVIPVADSSIVFPVPNVLTDGIGDRADLPGAGATGPGAFTWNEFIDRIDMPMESDFGDGADLASIGSVVPWVLDGPAPLTGSIMVGLGGSQLLGRVVERPGLPTLERSGQSLVSLELVGLDSVYDHVVWDIPWSDFATAGIIPTAWTYTYECAADVAADDCPDPALTPEQTVVNGAIPAIGGGAGRSRPAHGPIAQAPTRRAPLITGPCIEGLKTFIGSAKIGVEFEVRPQGEMPITYYENIIPYRVRFREGFVMSAKVSVQGELQLGASLPLDCVVKELGATDLAVPLGPASAFISIAVERQLKLKGDLKFEVGPRLQVSVDCSAKADLMAGFDWVSGEVPVPYSHFEKDWKCAPSLAFSSGQGDAGLPWNVELTVGPAAAVPVGVRIGGAVTKLLSRIIANTRLGVVQFSEFAAGPRLKLVAENHANVLSGQKGNGTARVEINGKAEIKVPAFQWIAGKLLGKSAPTFTFTAFELNEILLTIYKSLSEKSGGRTFEVNGTARTADAYGVIEVAEGDELAAVLPWSTRRRRHC